ncbi:MAG: cell division protein FtsZ [Brumimicrobium sp.]|nr:cell division protein FtsZ [Brumimicrobium sp.]
MEFDIPKDYSSIIKVIGVGGGGSNAVNHMYKSGFKGVDFIVCNTDKQALDASPVPLKVQLGISLTEGRGAGSIPEIGMNAAIENIEEIRQILSNDTKMVFVTAGLGGGTGTGAAPVIAKTAREMGILTVGIVTVPFGFEGKKRRQQAELGLEKIRDAVDTLVVINNERLREISGNLTIGNAFAQADNILSTAAKGISDVISVTGAINVDFNDVNTVMKNSGVAVMGSAIAEGENRAIRAVQAALASPLLNDNDIEGAEYVLLNITYGSQEVLMDEISDITDYIQDEAGSTADVIWGHGYDESLGESLCVTIIATGFKHSPVTGFERAPEKTMQVLEDTPKKEIVAPLTDPVKKNEYVAPMLEEEPYLKSNEEVEAKTENESTQGSFNWEIKPINSTYESPLDSIEEVEDSQKGFASFEANSSDIFEANSLENFEVSSESVESNESFESNELFSFEIKSEVETEEKEEVKRYFLDEDQNIELTDENTSKPHKLSQEEMQKRANERMDRIRNYTSHLSSAEGLNELEQEPAYKRRNIEIEDKTYSSENNISRFEITDNENQKGLRDTNSFLHDNVD